MSHTYETCMNTEVTADALGEEWRGYVVQISGGKNKQGLPRRQGVLPWPCSPAKRKGDSWYRPKRTEESTKLRRAAPWRPISVFSTWPLWKRGRKILLISLILLWLVDWSPKELAESANFSISKEDWLYPSICCEKAPKQRRQETQEQSSQDSVSCYCTRPLIQMSVNRSKETGY